jgi:hypothetical protein
MRALGGHQEKRPEKNKEVQKPRKKEKKFTQKEEPKIRMARGRQSMCDRLGVLGHPTVWSQEQAVTAINSWTHHNGPMAHPRMKHQVSSLDTNSRMIVADSGLEVICKGELCNGLGKSLVGGPAALNHGHKFGASSARVSRQLKSAAITWMTVREALSTVSAGVRAATLETVRAQLIAMIVELVPKVGREKDQHNVSEDDHPQLYVPGQDGGPWSPDESDEEGKFASRASIHTGGPLYRHRKRPRGPGQTMADEWNSSHGRRVAGRIGAAAGSALGINGQ